MDFEIVDMGHTKYLFRVKTSNDIVFELRDRFSSIRAFQAAVKKTIPVKTNIPDFPSKKFFGNMEPRFIKIRAKNLTQFLNMFLAIPMVKQHHLVPLYFRDKAYGDESGQSIEKLLRLSGYVGGKSIEKPWDLAETTEANSENASEQALS